MAINWDTHFHKIADRWVDDAYAPKPSDVPEIVYHYTDAAGLAGMMRSGVIWATDYRFLNDHSEIGHTKDIARILINERLAKCDNEITTEFYNEVRTFQDIESDTDVFLFSLSEERDDLSQWRGYAREGLGFTVGLCGPSLSKEALSNKKFSFFKMEYDYKRQHDALKKALADVETEVLNRAEGVPDERDKIIEIAAREFDWCCEQRAAGNKHKSFRLEQEWRIVTYVADENKKKNVKTRVNGPRLINYVEVGLTEASKLPILEIGIGPGFTGAEQKRAVEALCRETDYKPDIYPADTPYRRV